MYQTQIASIAKQASDLHNKALSGQPITSRDVAVCVELNQMYFDFLEELEISAKISDEVVCAVDGQAIKFKSIDDFSNWLVEIVE